MFEVDKSNDDGIGKSWFGEVVMRGMRWARGA